MTTGNNTRASKLSSRTNLSEISTADTGIVEDIDNKVIPPLQNPIPCRCQQRLFRKLSNIDYTPTPKKQNDAFLCVCQQRLFNTPALKKTPPIPAPRVFEDISNIQG